MSVATFREMDPAQLSLSPFQLIGKEWMLITAEKDGVANTMTASWGGLGVLWGSNVAFAFVRQSRYTYEFMEGASHFSLTFFDESYRKALSYCGSVSGRQEPKIEKSGLTVLHRDGIPYFGEGKLVLLCRKLYRQDLEAEHFVDRTLLPKWYGDHDFHRVYVGEIVNALTKDTER